MKSYPTSLLEKTQKVQADDPLLDLWTITLDRSPVAVPTLFATPHPGDYDPADPRTRVPVHWGGIDFWPFPLARGPITEESEGGLPRTVLAIANVTRELVHYLARKPGIRGQQIDLTIVERGLLGTGDEVTAQYSWVVRGVEVTDQAIAMDLAPPVEFGRLEVPRRRFWRDRCPHKYRDPFTCAYEGDLPTCDHTLFGADGCQVHGDDEVAHERPRQHPLLYGGFPGVSRRFG